MPLPFVDADEVLDYIRTEARAGAEDVKAWRDARLTEVRQAGARAAPELVQMLDSAVRMHRQYLETLRSTIVMESLGRDLDPEG